MIGGSFLFHIEFIEIFRKKIGDKESVNYGSIKFKRSKRSKK